MLQRHLPKPFLQRYANMHVLFLVRTNKCIGLFNSLTKTFFLFLLLGWWVGLQCLLPWKKERWRDETELGCWGRHWRIRLAVPAADKCFGVIIAVVSVPSSPPCSNNLYPDSSPGPSVRSGCPRAWPEQQRRSLDCSAAPATPHTSSC